MAVTADILLTIVLIHVLRQNRTGVKRTDSMLDVMIMYSMNTGLLTGVFNLLSLLFAFIRPADLIYIGIGIPGTKMYANTLLAALNSRHSLKAKCTGPLLETSPFGFSIQPDSRRDASAGPVSPRMLHMSPRRTMDAIIREDSSAAFEFTTRKPDLVHGISTEDISMDIETGDRK
ncbi:hypothetical protein C8Q76DRAFT_749192 [Earliella scabrosa]|nr:hypothetical protein C8Q76DRAFT_749192 [Earliella scabrosa]